MINNRLFKKINAIFWGILTWFPVVILILSVFLFEFTPQIDNQSPLGIYFGQFLSAIADTLSNGSDYWYNPLTDIFYNLFGLLDSIGSGTFYTVLADLTSWVCWVQFIRLLVYVFYWFIDLISGLFDLMTFNRKGDN